MKIGDLVQYRKWQKGDPPYETTPPERRGWEVSGIVVEICTWTVGKEKFLGEGILMLTPAGEFVEAWIGDLHVISKRENKKDYRRRFDYWAIPSCASCC